MKIDRTHGGEVWSFNSKVIDFSSNINPFGPPKKVLQAVKNSLWKIKYYPDQTCKDLIKSLKEYTGIREENILVGNGSTEIIKIFCDAFLRKGKEVIIPLPTFSEYEANCLLRGARINYIYPTENLDIPHEKILEEISNAVAIFLCSPNNPTGKMMEEKKIEEIILSCLESNCLVLLDEAYIEFTNSRGFGKKVEEYENLAVLRSLTKFFSIPGLRIGYCLASEKIMNILKSETIPWNVNVIAQEAGVACLKDKDFIENSRRKIAKERDFMKGELEKMGLKVFDSDANFILINLREKGIKATDVKAALIKKRLLIRECSSFKGLDPYYIRISIRKRKENLILLREMKEVLG
jgi:threonine-phosphate decarboxylase